jgi:hypothetical protein
MPFCPHCDIEIIRETERDHAARADGEMEKVSWVSGYFFWLPDCRQSRKTATGRDLSMDARPVRIGQQSKDELADATVLQYSQLHL